MTRAVWDDLVAALRKTHSQTPALRAFCPFPDDLIPLDVTRHQTAGARLCLKDKSLRNLSPLVDAILAAAPKAHWRETYKQTRIGRDFVDRFGCYRVIGRQGAFLSDQMFGFVIYMPPYLYYPYHHHPAEELYFVLAGRGEFQCVGHPAQVVKPGGHVFHGAGIPHAISTCSDPLLAYVIWRNGLDGAPVWMDETLNN